MSSEQLYKEAYSLHYNKNNPNDALVGYLKVIKEFPDSKEAGYSKTQVQNIISQIDTTNITIHDSELSSIYESIYTAYYETKYKEKQIADEYAIKKKAAEEAAAEEEAWKNAFLESQINFMCTTGSQFEGYSILEYITICGGSSALFTGKYTEKIAQSNNLFSGNSAWVTPKIEKAKRNAIADLIWNCKRAGANAVIGVSVSLSVMGTNMILASATGTAVVIDNINYS